MKGLYLLSATMLLLATFHFEMQGQEYVNELEQLSFYMGTWGPPKGDPMIGKNPKMADYKVISFRWGKDKRVIWSKTGQVDDASSEGMITFNPTSKSLVWLEYQIDNEILFEGEYRVLDKNKVQREYTVYYAEGYKSIPYPNKEGWTRKFRETFTPISDNMIDWLTEVFLDGKWVRHTPVGKEFRAERDR